MIAETRSFAVGPFTVQQKPRLDNPFWPQYLVFRAGRLVGKQFSVPDEEACHWLESHQDGKYADSSAKFKRWSTLKR